MRVVKYLCNPTDAPEVIHKIIGWEAKRFRSADAIIATREDFIAWHKSQEKVMGEKRFDPVRYFCNDDELIHSGGKTWVFSNQWTAQKVDELISELKRAFPDKPFSCTAVA